MQRPIDPRERSLEFRFDGADRLYRDHHGRRVIADVEGSGRFQIDSALADLSIEVDETPSPVLQGHFDANLLVASHTNGDVRVRVYTGPVDPPDGPLKEASEVHGAGWIVSADGPLFLDDRHETSPPPIPGFPTPFFRLARGPGIFRFVPAATACQPIDSFSIDDTAARRARAFRVQNLSAVTTLESSYENGDRHTAPVASHLNAASWRCPVQPGAAGLMLRRTYDRFHGRQRARVFVDGRFAGWWYDPAQNRSSRWAVSDFGVASELVAGQSEVEIVIDPPAGSALWSVSTIETFTLKNL
jgi:hypothetical protein